MRILLINWILAANTSVTVGSLAIVEGLDQLTIQKDIQPVSSDIYGGAKLLPMVFQANEEALVHK